MNKLAFTLYIALILLSNCGDDHNEDPIPNPSTCQDDGSLDHISKRNFKMGFSSWSFGPEQGDIEETYRFISNNADIYSEQIDHVIPWAALISGNELPTEFTTEIDSRISRQIAGHKLLLSVSLLNSNRSDLLEDIDGSMPPYTSLTDTHIEDAYVKYLKYLIGRFNPDFLVTAMEVNDLFIASESKWNEYRLLIQNVRTRIKSDHPTLLMSESLTLHNWFGAEVSNPNVYLEELRSYSTELDFVSVSYYPFFKGQHTKNEFQKAFDFLHLQSNKPIAFVETTHIAEDLDVPDIGLSIDGNECEQKDYLETLLFNAHNNDYEFIIWWSFKDYDKLWQTFSEEDKDLGQVWRDTGLFDENGNERAAWLVWNEILRK